MGRYPGERTPAAAAVRGSDQLDPLVVAKGGERWATELGELVAALVEDWGITVGQQLLGGTSSYVTRVRTAAGQPAVLKIAVPGADFERQVDTLLAAAGRGYVRVLASDAARRALLLEALGVPLGHSGLGPHQQLSILAALVPASWELPTSGRAPVDKAAQLIDVITANSDRRHVRVIDEALRLAERRSQVFEPDRCVVVHGDAAAANVLERTGEGWVFVDPDGFVGDRAYDRGVAARDWCTELLTAASPRALLRSYCQTLGGSPEVTWEWAFIERVSTGLYIEALGGDGSAHLTSAAAVFEG